MQFRVTAEAELRNAPERSAPVVARLPAGTIVERTDKRNRRWLLVRHGATTGWIAERRLEKIGEPEPHGGQVSTENDIIEIIRQAARAFGQPRGRPDSRRPV